MRRALMAYSFRTQTRSFRIATVALAVIGVGTLFGVVWHRMDGVASCSNVVLSSTRSPDGSKAVFVFRQQCGATVPDSLYATVAMTDRPFSPDRNHAFLGLVGGTEVLSSWSGNEVVEIGLIPGRDRGFIRHEEAVDNVRIIYK
jgi:hypothetical protein